MILTISMLFIKCMEEAVIALWILECPMEISIKKSDAKSKAERLSCNRPLQFIVLSKQGSEFRRNECRGTLIYTGKSAIEISIGVPLQHGDVVLWDDIHKPVAVHAGIVKWSRKEDELYTGGLQLL